MNPLEAPYKKIKAAEEKIEENFLLQVYADAFRKKFFGPPIFPASNIHLTNIRDIKKACGDRAMEIIQHYFEMPDSDGWFTKQGYSLHELYRSLNRINASFHKKQGVKTSGLQIEETFHCDACWKPFQFIHALNITYDKLIRCPECEKTGAKAKVVSGQDKLKTLMKLSTHFPSLPGVVSTTQEDE